MRPALADDHKGGVMPEALKPCPNPWCDSVDFEAEPTEGSVQLLLDTSRPRFAVYCQYCPQQGPGADTLAEAITAWNTRTTDPEIARLQDLVAKFQRGGVSTLFAEGNVDG